MDGQSQLRANAELLEQGLARRRDALEGLDVEHRSRRAEAIDGISHYVALLRKATEQSGGLPIRYCFKLEFPDGRWTVAEKLLPAEPHVGDVVRFDEGETWRVRDSQLVWPRPQRLPRREVFVCALAAA